MVQSLQTAYWHTVYCAWLISTTVLKYPGQSRICSNCLGTRTAKHDCILFVLNVGCQEGCWGWVSATYKLTVLCWSLGSTLAPWAPPWICYCQSQFRVHACMIARRLLFTLVMVLKDGHSYKSIHDKNWTNILNSYNFRNIRFFEVSLQK